MPALTARSGVWPARRMSRRSRIHRSARMAKVIVIRVTIEEFGGDLPDDDDKDKGWGEDTERVPYFAARLDLHVGEAEGAQADDETKDPGEDVLVARLSLGGCIE